MNKPHLATTSKIVDIQLIIIIIIVVTGSPKLKVDIVVFFLSEGVCLVDLSRLWQFAHGFQCPGFVQVELVDNVTLVVLEISQ